MGDLIEIRADQVADVVHRLSDTSALLGGAASGRNQCVAESGVHVEATDDFHNSLLSAAQWLGAVVDKTQVQLGYGAEAITQTMTDFRVADADMTSDLRALVARVDGVRAESGLPSSAEAAAGAGAGGAGAATGAGAGSSDVTDPPSGRQF